ncbi:hypothetical protein C499_07380 [Halogeometricum borinquense DSM 11551]|uniref:Uncharacterized protein n=2 Tax=Halogeometricum borinquense TaxID=60847 RepID=E4NVF1_HALBP|nr:hypothetical protein Hbor_33100 [Halogeometricum borinquense DSM 11551]ELY28734.1 hypothetical protein C499_07380 [Halogeometricum borinquense DSM 11551]
MGSTLVDTATATAGYTEFDEVWWDRIDNTWYTKWEAPSDWPLDLSSANTYDAGITISRVLYLANITEQPNGNYNYDTPGYEYEFGLNSFGVVAARPRDSADGSGPLDEPESGKPAFEKAFHSKHTLESNIENYSGTNNLSSMLNPDQIHLHRGVPDAVVEASGNDWLTDKDLENVDTSETNTKIVGGAGLALGVLGATIPSGVGQVASGASIALSAGTLVSDLLDTEPGSQQTMTDDTWKHQLKENNDKFYGDRKNIAGFQHSANLPLFVPEGESMEISFRDRIEFDGDDRGTYIHGYPVGADEFIKNNLEDSFTVSIPANEVGKEADIPSVTDKSGTGPQQLP